MALRYEEFPSDGVLTTLAHAFVRPPRLRYEKKLLEKVMREAGREAEISEHSVHFQGKGIKLSVLRNWRTDIFIVFCHGNSSCRVESMNVAKHMPPEFSFCAFDFIGCGNPAENEESLEYISLGVKESRQIKAVVRFVKEHFRTEKVVLWGRSMGATSILLSGGAGINVLDSPFSDIREVSRDMVLKEKPRCVPGCLFDCIFNLAFCVIKRKVGGLAGVQLQQLRPLQRIEQIEDSKVLIFMSGCKDSFVKMYHSIAMFKEYEGPKELLIFEGTHNSFRSKSTYADVFELILQYSEKLSSSGGWPAEVDFPSHPSEPGL